MNKEIVYLNDVVFSQNSGELTHAVGFLKSLARKDYNIMFYTIKKNKTKLASLEKYKNIKIKYTPFVFNVVLSRVLYNVICLFIYNFSMCKFYIRLTNYSPVLLLKVLIIRKKCFVEVNGVSEIESKAGYSLLLNKIISKINFFMCRQVKSVISVSSGITEYLKDVYSLDRVLTINNGTELVKKDLSVRKDNDDWKNIVFIGNFAKWQNFQYLIDCVYSHRSFLLKKKIRFKLYGTGKSFNFLEKEINLKMLSDLIFLEGKIQRNKIPEVLNIANAGLLIDTRFYKEKPLFSPLKMYEYNSFDLPTFFVSPYSYPKLQDKGFYILNLDDFKDISLFLNNEFNLESYRRTWDDVVNEFIWLNENF
ncbi:hypothetical protein C5610_02520 [Idiomarina sp. OT37-5b]|uniref:hypothetical protein n=1 Tax=Idiomarina sp. OT37-5b TaxID=2100422 RepID=UPI000CF979F6|nr:hypothetical protein [Idiomarina sp. OT37-5b]AVJ55274.1 hypothetical protein C5610_02520 [Idiomarina sp. OT37-5b]